jgi:hypothetical protein
MRERTPPPPPPGCVYAKRGTGAPPRRCRLLLHRRGGCRGQAPACRMVPPTRLGTARSCPVVSLLLQLFLLAFGSTAELFEPTLTLGTWSCTSTWPWVVRPPLCTRNQARNSGSQGAGTSAGFKCRLGVRTALAEPRCISVTATLGGFPAVRRPSEFGGDIHIDAHAAFDSNQWVASLCCFSSCLSPTLVLLMCCIIPRCAAPL